MKITLLSDTRLRLEMLPGNGMLTIEAPSAELQYSPFHMMASGLAVCTYSVLHSWAAHAKLDADGLIIEVEWSFADKPHRIGEYRMDITWPGLEPERDAAARRAAELCAVHATFSHPPPIQMQLNTK